MTTNPPLNLSQDFNGLQTKSFRVENLSAAPTAIGITARSPLKGDLYFDTTLNQLGYYNGTAWVYGSEGVVESIGEGTAISVNNTDPSNPIVSVVIADLINDVGTSDSDIWSAEKVQDVVDALEGTLGALALKNTIDSSSLLEDEVVSEGKLSTAVQTKLNANAAKTTVATTDPTVDNDSSEGYSVRSLWLNSATLEGYLCFDATVGAAVWVKDTLTIDELGALALKNTIDSASLLDSHVVELGKIEQIGAKKLLGNSTASTADVEEISVSTLGLSLIDSANAAAAQSTLGLVIGTDVLAPNAAITGATKTKITYDANGLVTSGADATTADIADSSDKRYVTDAQLSVIENTSGTNTGDQTISIVGDISASGSTGELTAAIGDNKVLYNMVKRYAGSFTTGTFSAGSFTISAATHGLGVGVYEIELINSSGKAMTKNLQYGEDTNLSTGAITISVEPGFEFAGSLVITRKH